MVQPPALRFPLTAATRRYLSAKATKSNSNSNSNSNSLPDPENPPLAITASRIVHKTYPFFVRRTSNNTLPVYTDIRNGLTRKLTIIRKVEGDVDALVSHLKKDFPKVPDSVFVSKPYLQQVVIKGFVRDEIMIWLAQMGF